MCEEMRATNDNDNELEMWENVSFLIQGMPILIKRRNCLAAKCFSRD